MSADSGQFILIGTVSSQIDFSDIEQAIYDGKSGGDALSILGTAGADHFALTPGAANDAGTLSMDLTLPLTFQNLGSGGTLKVQGNGGGDTLTYYGTATNDNFTVNASGSGPLVNLNSRISVFAIVDNLTLEGLGGDDVLTLLPAVQNSPFSVITFNGGGQASPSVRRRQAGQLHRR